MKNCKHILVSRTDSIGDVLLSLPFIGLLNQVFPKAKISFLGQSYTKPIIECCQYIDSIYYWDEVKNKPIDEQVKFLKRIKADTIVHIFPQKQIAEAAKIAGIKNRIGTSRRIFHLLTCNYLVNLTRKNSDLHEAQLNIKLLRAFEYDLDCPIDEIPRFYGFTNIPKLKPSFEKYFLKDKFNLIVHPKSKGSAREWGLSNYTSLIHLLPEDKFNILITGTPDESELIRANLPIEKNNVSDLSGSLTLSELIGFINHADGLIAASTGPLHIAAALDKHAIGIYSPMKPIHPGRWAPLGPKSKTFVAEKSCSDCRNLTECACIKGISPEEIKDYLLKLPVPTLSLKN